MKKWFVSTAACTLALAAAVAGSAQRTPTAVQARPTLVVPYLSHGAGVWVEGRTGRPVAVTGSAAPATPGLHYARR
jgi:hypothetical protein